jgi:peptidoglycan/LPS O-acetylase OafA/YrhL
MVSLQVALDARGRANNFTLLRLVAALAVVYGHSFEIAWPAPGQADLIALTLRETWAGEIGVWIFFVISGFLVTKSWTERRDIVAFAKARALRLFPALLTMLALLVFMLGPVFSALPWTAYFRAPDTYGYLVWNGSLVKTVYVLPGVFETNPYPAIVNKSLWTLPLEARLYILLAAAGLIGLLRRRAAFNAATLAGGALIAAEPQWFPLNGVSGASLALMFLAGSAAFVNRDWIPLSASVLAAGIALAALLMGTPLFRPALAGIVAYATLWLAYGAPSRPIDRWGDASYGVYIYAFPIQQALVAMVPEITPLSLFGLAGALSVGLGAASWHWIEAPCLALKHRPIKPLSCAGLAAPAAEAIWHSRDSRSP